MSLVSKHGKRETHGDMNPNLSFYLATRRKNKIDQSSTVTWHVPCSSYFASQTLNLSSFAIEIIIYCDTDVGLYTLMKVKFSKASLNVLK